MSSLPIQALERAETLTQRVTKKLEDLILNGVLTAGQKMPAAGELSKMFGVSRPVIREAICDLAARGLLDIRSGEGAVVQGPNTDWVAKPLTLWLRSGKVGISLKNVHEVRSVLEVEMAGWAAHRATSEDIDALEDILQRMQESVDPEIRANLDFEFHSALSVAAHNPLYIVLLDSIGGLLLEVRRNAHRAFRDEKARQRAVMEHRDVLEKVKSSDSEGARKAMSTHMAESQKILVESLGSVRHQLSPHRTSEGTVQVEQ